MESPEFLKEQTSELSNHTISRGYCLLLSNCTCGLYERILLIAVRLDAEVLTKGLLTARNGCVLLVTTLANNPNLIESGAHFLCHILKTYANLAEFQPSSPHHPDNTAKSSTGLW